MLIPGVGQRRETAGSQEGDSSVTGATVVPNARPASGPLTIRSTEQRAGYRLQTVSLRSDGVHGSGTAGRSDRTGAKPAVLMMSAQPLAAATSTR